MPLEQFLRVKWESIFDKLAGSTPVCEEIIFKPTEVLDFFNRLEKYKVALHIVKDPYKLAFAPDYLLWFMQEDITYIIFISPESKTWKMLQHYFEISFPTTTHHPWLKEIPWKKFKEKEIKFM